MGEKTISFTYEIGNARFTTTTEVNTSTWDSLDEDARSELLTEAALEEVQDGLNVDMSSIEEDDQN